MQFSGTKKELQVEREACHLSDCYQQGKVDLPLLREPLDNTKLLRKDNRNRSKKYTQNIRLYNSMFAFTSMGGEVDTEKMVSCLMYLE